jgi:hypothetical protein
MRGWSGAFAGTEANAGGQKEDRESDAECFHGEFLISDLFQTVSREGCHADGGLVGSDRGLHKSFLCATEVPEFLPLSGILRLIHALTSSQTWAHAPFSRGASVGRPMRPMDGLHTAPQVRRERRSN